MIALDGAPGDWLPDGFEVIAQRGDGLAERLAAAFADVGGPAFLVGMDTPQLTPELLDAGLAAVADGDSAFGAALDGGYWGIGLRTPDPAVFAGVPMSTARTGAVQRAQMSLLGLHPPSCRRCWTSTPSRTRWPSPPTRPARASPPRSPR